MADTSITMGFRPPQINDPINVMAAAESAKAAKMKNALAEQAIREANSPEALERKRKEAARADQMAAIDDIKYALPVLNPSNWNKFGQYMQSQYGDPGVFGQDYGDGSAHAELLKNFGFTDDNKERFTTSSLVYDEQGNAYQPGSLGGLKKVELPEGGQLGLSPKDRLDYVRQRKIEEAKGAALGGQEANLATGRPQNALPLDAFKYVQELESSANIAGQVSNQLDNFISQIDSGSLDLGMFSNLWSKGKNLTGMSDQQSRNFASLQAGLEKLRNDSLRLNKGPQTDGDAQRAWNELIDNLNDPQVVKQRMAEIKELNENAAMWHMRQANEIRQNYGSQAPQQQNMYSQSVGSSPASQKTISLQNVRNTAAAKGWTLDQAIQEAEARGYTIR